MSKKSLIILLVLIILTMGFLIWFQNSEDINSNVSVQDNDEESTPSQSTGGIDINLSDDTSISTENENSGEVILSGDTLNNSGEKEPIVEPEVPNQDEDNVTNNEVESGEIASSGETVNPKLVSDDTKLVFKLGAKQIIAYYYQGEEITGMESYIDYQTENSAKSAAEKYNDGTNSLSDIGNIKSASSQGKYVVMTYNESEYEELTVSKLRTMYKNYEIKK